MAEPLLNFLEGRAKAALPFFRQGVRLGLGSNDILVMVGERFGGIRRQTGLDIIAALRGRIDPSRIERLVGPETPFPQELHTINPAPQSTNYQYVIGFNVGHTENPDFLTVSSAVPLSAAQIRDAGVELGVTHPEYEIAIDTINPSDITIIEANVGTQVGAPGSTGGAF